MSFDGVMSFGGVVGLKNRLRFAERTVLSAACSCALALGARAEGTTWYWHPTSRTTRTNPTDNQNFTGYYWQDANNWTNAAGAAGIPQRGDSVEMGVSDTLLSAFAVCGVYQSDSKNFDVCTNNAIRGILIESPWALNQGNVTLICGPDCTGVTYAGRADKYNSLGLVLTGSGEAPIDIRESGVTWALQMRMRCHPADSACTLVKKGAGRFVSFYQNNAYTYDIPVTKIQSGTMTPNSRDEGLAGKEFYFDGNDPSQRLELGYGYDHQCDFILKNGLLAEINGVDNTEHGIVSSYDHVLKFTGTPKAETMRFTGSFYEFAGLQWSPASDGYTFVIAKSRSTTRGRIVVDRGTVRLAEGASFTSLSNVTVSAGASLVIDEGCSVTCGSATICGTSLPEGVHTAAEAGFTGGGTLTVEPSAPLYGLDRIILDIPAGSTKTLAAALADYNAANGTDYTVAGLNGGALKDHTLVKRGAGTLTVDTGNPLFQGLVFIEAGECAVPAQYGLGKSDNDVRPIHVRAGATLFCEYTVVRDNVTRNGNRIVHIAGTGFNGRGALRTTNTFLNYGSVNIFGKEIVLDGDALVVHGNWYQPAAKVTLNGHELTFRGAADGATVYFQTVNGGGRIKFIQSQSRSSNIVFNDPDPSNTLEFGNGGGFRFWGNANSGAGLKTWNYAFTGGTTYVFGDDTAANPMSLRDNDKNTIWGPISISSKILQASQGNTTFSTVFYRGRVSGAGGFGTSASVEPDYIHLMNPANDFSGGVRIGVGVLCVYGNGTLPDTGTVTIDASQARQATKNMYRLPEFYGVALFSPEACSLPPLVYEGVATTSRVQGGRGAWKSVVKKDSGTMEYFSEAGAPLLDIRGGTMRLPRGAAPGLWEGTNTYATAAAAATAYAGTETGTNLVMRGPTSANNICYQAPSVPNDKKVITDTGYIWNRGAASVTWTFAHAVNGTARLLIDGDEVLKTTSKTPAKGTVTLAPGPHAFEWRGCGATPGATSGTWPERFGFVWDSQGRDSLADTNNFAICVDPGDGSLFTRTLETSAALPSFDAIHVAAGATLDVNGNVYVANDICGAGTVTSSATDASAAPRLVVKAMTVNTAANETLAVSVPVEFDAELRIHVTNETRCVRHTILTANTALTLPASVQVIASDVQWHAALSADGRSLEIAPTGLLLLFR